MLCQRILLCFLSSLIVSSLSAESQSLMHFHAYEGSTFLAVSQDSVWLLDVQAGMRSRFVGFNLPERISDLSRGALRSVAVSNGKPWALWSARLQDRSVVSYISELSISERSVKRDVRLEQPFSPFDFAFAEDGTLFLLGRSPEFPELIWRLDSEGRFLGSFFVDSTITRDALSYESQLFVKGNRLFFVVPSELKVFEMTLDGTLINLYEFDTATEMPRSAFQGSDGSVYVDLFFGVKRTVSEGPDKGGIAFRNPGVRIVRLEDGRIEEVLVLSPGPGQRPTFRGLINGQFVEEAVRGLLSWHRERQPAAADHRH